MLVDQNKISMNKFVENFESAYKQFLVDDVYHGDEDMCNQLLEDKKTKKLIQKIAEEYFECIYEFYNRYPQGNYLEESNFLNIRRIKIREGLKENEISFDEFIKKYEERTNDKNLSGFLKVYAYVVEANIGLLYDKNGFNKDKIAGYFKDSANLSRKMYKDVKNDIMVNNLWWVKETASTLRRQLESKTQYIASSRMQKMCDKYINRFLEDGETKVEWNKFLTGNLKDEDGEPMNLVRKLDLSMLKNFHAQPSYFWDAENGGLNYDLYPPKSGNAYSFVLYQNYTNTKEGDADRGHAL